MRKITVFMLLALVTLPCLSQTLSDYKGKSCQVYSTRFYKFTGTFIGANENTVSVIVDKNVTVLKSRSVYKEKGDTIAIPFKYLEKIKFFDAVWLASNPETITIDMPKHFKQANPMYYDVSQALKTSGGVCLGIGVPSLATGVILVAIGYSNSGVGVITQGNCATAGGILTAFGGALTVAGIPLYATGVKLGKRNGELSFNTYGTGAGVSLRF
ncbi:MAG: hypothetical protein MJ010_01895 [Paludibacteraceae bacterium]|nr:hypothetical protein [Paludibacteraceae bacterium]